MDFDILIFGVPFGFKSATATLTIFGYPFGFTTSSILLLIVASFTIGITWWSLYEEN